MCIRDRYGDRQITQMMRAAQLLATRVGRRQLCSAAPSKLNSMVKAFAGIPKLTLPSLQSLHPDVVDRATQELCSRGERYVSVEDVESFLLWHGVKTEDVASLFHVMDKKAADGKERVLLQRFVVALSVLAASPVDQNLSNLFRAFDENRDGVLTRSELEFAMATLFKVSAELSNPLHNLGPHSKTRASIDATARHVTAVGFEHADTAGNGVLDQDEFREWLLSDHESAVAVRSILDAVGAHKA
eukprot:TRINITY_DN40634_c0_g2_i2.p1 TRINITY_DN40634_c0_g2~~TRINITY_DN40634_c0_g2_i2.p1  ORF type:complete len:244 (-),score=36.44 TRINITY_DN40634_c0_g2_i2:179-910(-)